ncbi:MAG: threonine--tRNA ligase [Candidatus Aminicenantes bacterium]|nr:threonine--tRNA ligase [Candidatus Aminicenantes bacterium]NIM82881.1 threonine--tRNA ligase [Candidatus Aminicenantes bacterium]NIN22257.1 threonine--tRNA ligase [Candidatus Aminicenantes bacterium]NIN46025.1 threonine--tRNA ligase [Candidatus Aminicenantes bacterium]NIN88861.1 threonine--tRNA ligase [Candidatus Aminicenantes bacterium]
MRVLFLHADRFSYEVTGETSITKQLDPIPPEMLKGNADNVLVCMISIEKGDGDTLQGVVDKAAADIADQCEKVDSKNVFLYPYAHLSPTLETPRTAVKILDQLAVSLSGLNKFTVYRAPFGFYKRFDIKVKGHPLSELGRTIRVEEGEKESSGLKAEEEKISEWLIMTPDGKVTSADDFNFQEHRLFKTFFDYETQGSRLSEEAPPHIRLMQEHELVDYEPASDAGNFRWYPKGYVMKKILEEQINAVLNQYGAMQVETPIMYSLNHPALAKYLDKFPARQYTVSSDKSEYFLRFAACFGQYLMKHDMQISYRQLPIRLYELTHFSFRREQTGELVGLKRLRAFTMPDMHTLCADIPQSIEEMLNQVKLCLEWMDNLGFKRDEYVVALRAVKGFYEENGDYVKRIAEYCGTPILIELWPEQYFYFITKFEVNCVDSQGKASALSTVQIDVKNPADFGITYIDKNSEPQHPMMLHTSVSGSIDRNLYALLEQEAIKMKKGQKTSFPFWLSPTQIRLIPVKDDHLPHALELAKKLPGRIDIDDRSETVSKRIRMAEKEWIPLIIVLGDKEIDSDTLPVRIRGKKETENLTVEQVCEYFDGEMKGKVLRPLNLPMLVSHRPQFRG